MTAAKPIEGPPFAWAGSKWTLAPLVWRLLGDPDLYAEPFAGTLSVLLRRPAPRGIEVVGDLDGLLANFWRSVQREPDAVAQWADYPVVEAEIHAWHARLVAQRDDVTARLIADPEWCDPQAAGRWAWGASCWFGSAWCPPRRPHRQRPAIHYTRGVRCGDVAARIDALAERMRDVRVLCGPWDRVVSPALTRQDMGMVGVYLDPPYDPTLRAKGLYALDGTTDLVSDVRAWCLARGRDPHMRIALSGVAGEHAALEEAGWAYHVVPVNGRSEGEGLWASPHCLPLAPPHVDLFGGSP